MRKKIKQKLIPLIQTLIEDGEITVFDEVNKNLYRFDEISVCMAGDSIQVNVKDKFTITERIKRWGSI